MTTSSDRGHRPSFRSPTTLSFTRNSSKTTTARHDVARCDEEHPAAPMRFSFGVRLDFFFGDMPTARADSAGGASELAVPLAWTSRRLSFSCPQPLLQRGIKIYLVHPIPHSNYPSLDDLFEE